MSLIFNPNWILCSSWVRAALLDKLALGAIIGFLWFVGIVRFSFDSGVLSGVQVKYSLACKWEIVKAFPGSIELFWCLSIIYQHVIADKGPFLGWDIIEAFPGNVGRA